MKTSKKENRAMPCFLLLCCKVLLSNYAFSKPYSSNNPHEVCVLVEAAEAVATDFVRFGDEGESIRIRFGDDVFDFVDLAL